MAYYEKTVIAGLTMERMKMNSARLGRKGLVREKNHLPTPEDVQKVNAHQSEAKLRWSLNTNFGENDIHLVLTYIKGMRPPPEEAKQYLDKFLRDLRTLYRKHGQELKYISVTEYLNKAIHHHLVINSIDMREVTQLWPYGRARPTYLDGSGQYGQLAAYLIKETEKTFRLPDAPYRKRWNSSRNLKKPIIKIRVIGRDSWRKEPKAPKGYIIEKDKTVNGVSEITGYPYQFYSMIRVPENQTGRTPRKSTRKRE